MIAEQLLNLLFAIVQGVFTLATNAIPQVDLAEKLLEYTLEILNICTQGANFVRFMIGDLAIPLIEVTIMLIIYKYTLFPIIQFIRSIFVNSN